MRSVGENYVNNRGRCVLVCERAFVVKQNASVRNSEDELRPSPGREMTRTTLLNRGSRVSFARTSDSKSCFCCVCLQSVVRLGLIRVGKTADRSRENKEQKRNGPVETTRASRCAGERRRWRRRKSQVVVGVVVGNEKGRRRRGGFGSAGGF